MLLTNFRISFYVAALCEELLGPCSLAVVASNLLPIRKSTYASLRPLARPAKSCNRPKPNPLYNPILAVGAAVGVGNLSL